jgi:hypothetical protein
MKSLTLGIAVVGLCCSLSISSKAQGSCDLTTMKGIYGFAGTGFVPEKVDNGIRFDPVSHVATANYDGQGNVTVNARVQYHGKISPVNFSGSYEVGTDCTGSAKLHDSDGNILLAWAFVIVHKGEEVETIAVRAASQSRPMYSLTFSQKKR